mmetsp:Transcript_17541/g.33526  ORF Transcript_17541/g.33526 Transcript_17541/m.33526 type:complete len:302 (-) Transcript_17541:380-1285(-)|eukprot:CAMPEP_0114252532 /NCGR_PEP_ID=MMETSP0058-20121206/15888_1 /TAXON_ID=36894 /ORGANISM="Pyramimonas parkeae, CCMP726" /LENGTH=301 /DNA_ID=CAMNT_0001366475 /DNA_START=332 /DNA_END=1237 /DNA_ORIENTATION=+
MGVEKTLALIKPDAVRNGYTENILQAIELSGFTIVTRQRVQLTRERAADFYAEHEGKPFFETLVNFMSSGPLIALVLAKPEAIVAWRALMGPTNAHNAKQSEPRSLRARFGTDGTMNATHGSDSPASAAGEVRFFFPKLSLDALPDATAARAYVAKHLQPTLVEGLTCLCKAKPTADKLEAITWIAHWLLDNNPNKPRPVASADQASARVADELEELGGEAGAEEDEGLSIEAMEEELAATRLQSHFRGYMARKTAKSAKKIEGTKIVLQTHEMSQEDEAATKVQSMYRGHMARKQIKHKN